jgi:hypothetical protein
MEPGRVRHWDVQFISIIKKVLKHTSTQTNRIPACQVTDGNVMGKAWGRAPGGALHRKLSGPNRGTSSDRH